MLDLSFWRFIILLHVAKSGLWEKDGDIYFFHVGTFTNGVDKALNIIVLPFSLKIGLAW